MINIFKWPVIILASPRTGSTALGFQIQEQYKSLNVKYFSEPITVTGTNCFKFQDADEIKEFKETFYGKNSHYVVKFMPWQMMGVPEYQSLYKSDCFKIKLTRESELDQIISFYIGNMAGNSVQKEKTIPQYTIDINPNFIRRSISAIQDSNNFLKYSTQTFDIELTYESLNLADQTVAYKTTPPINIEEIQTAIKKIYERYI